MAHYRLTNGYTVTTSHTGVRRIQSTFEMKNPEGEVVSTVVKEGEEAAIMIRDLFIATALAASFQGMAKAGA